MIWVTAGPIIGLLLSVLALLLLILLMEPLLISISGAVIVQDQEVLDIFHNQIFKLGIKSRRLYYTEKFKGNLFDLTSVFSSRGILISKDLLDNLNKQELETVFFSVLYKSAFITSLLDKIGAVLFSIIRFPETHFAPTKNRASIFFYLVFKFLLSPLELLEKKFFDKENSMNLLCERFSQMGRDCMVLVSLGDKIRTGDRDELKVSGFSANLLNKFSLWTIEALDFYDLFFDLAPHNKTHWETNS